MDLAGEEHGAAASLVSRLTHCHAAFLRPVPVRMKEGRASACRRMAGPWLENEPGGSQWRSVLAAGSVLHKPQFIGALKRLGIVEQHPSSGTLFRRGEG